MRDLSGSEIERLLERGRIARIGVYDASRERVYMVPVSYYYREGAAYMHSAPGLKIDLMHEHPGAVCVEVDEIADEGEWLSAVGWGHVEEVADPAERTRVLRGFGERLFRGPLRDRQRVGRGGMLGAGETVYRVVLDEVTGRGDSSGWVSRESD